MILGIASRNTDSYPVRTKRIWHKKVTQRDYDEASIWNFKIKICLGLIDGALLSNKLNQIFI